MASYTPEDVAALVLSLAIGFLIAINITIRLYENEQLYANADEYVEVV